MSHVVLISAIKARSDVATDYAQSKLLGESVLREADIGWTILRPSLVYGDGSYGGTSLLRGMAGLPWITPVPARGDFPFTPVHVHDLARAVRLACEETRLEGQTLEPVGPETIELTGLLTRYRSWLVFGRARFLSVPMTVMRITGRLSDIIGDGPIATNSLIQMVAGNEGDSAAFTAAIGFQPRLLGSALAAHPAQVRDRWHARLFFLAPAIKAVLVLLWFASAWLGATVGSAQTVEREIILCVQQCAIEADIARRGLPQEFRAIRVIGAEIVQRK